MHLIRERVQEMKYKDNCLVTKPYNDISVRRIYSGAKGSITTRSKWNTLKELDRISEESFREMQKTQSQSGVASGQAQNERLNLYRRYVAIWYANFTVKYNNLVEENRRLYLFLPLAGASVTGFVMIILYSLSNLTLINGNDTVSGPDDESNNFTQSDVSPTDSKM